MNAALEQSRGEAIMVAQRDDKLGPDADLRIPTNQKNEHFPQKENFIKAHPSTPARVETWSLRL